MQAIRNFVDAITYPFRVLARIPSSVVSSPRRMLGLSLPARSALLLFFGLLAIVIVWAILRAMAASSETAEGFFSRELLFIVILVFIIPLVVWYALKLWLEGEPSPFPEIDRVWSAAMDSMREQSIDPSETPIFVVIGPPNERAARDFFAASNVHMPVCVPSGPAPLYVFANQQSIYLVCTQSSCVGTLLGGSPGATPASAPAAGSPDPMSTMQVSMQTMQIGNEGGAPPTAQSPTATAPFGINQPTMIPPAPSPGGTMDSIKGTMMVGQETQMPAQFGTPVANHSPRLDPAQAGEATAKLSHVCRCLRRVRDPLCPINGILVSTPFKLLADGNQSTVDQMQVAIKADLAALRMATRIRCSVTHIVEGMEEEPGFRELIRRVGADRVATQRFGKGYGLWNVPVKDQLDAVVRHACGAFEDWAYLLFREEEGLSKRGNRHLYRLLCRIRTTFRDRLSHLIQSVYAAEPNATSLAGAEPMLFSGCYFVASGQTPDRHAFLASVFQKSQSEEEELEWGSEAIGEERRLQTGVQVLLVISGILIAAIVAMLIYWYSQKSPT